VSGETWPRVVSEWTDEGRECRVVQTFHDGPPRFETREWEQAYDEDSRETDLVLMAERIGALEADLSLARARIAELEKAVEAAHAACDWKLVRKPGVFGGVEIQPQEPAPASPAAVKGVPSAEEIAKTAFEAARKKPWSEAHPNQIEDATRAAHAVLALFPAPAAREQLRKGQV